MPKIIAITSAKRFEREWPEIIEALHDWAWENKIDVTQFIFESAYKNPSNPKQISTASWYPIDFQPERLWENPRTYRYEWIISSGSRY